MNRLALLATLLPGLAWAQDRVTTATHSLRLVGVYDSQTGRPLDGVEFRNVATGTYATTSETGTAMLTFVTVR